MAYNQFTLLEVEQRFGLKVRQEDRLFAHVPPATISDRLRLQLTEDLNLGLIPGSEKGRSEFIIAPILAEVYRQVKDRATLFSGIQFDVDIPNGLTGYCDFLLALVPAALEIRAPVVAIVEAKRENIHGGIAQCLAELVAAQTFNAAQSSVIPTLYGVITTGTDWRFLKLRDTHASIDSDLYYLDNVEKIVGILLSMLNGH